MRVEWTTAPPSQGMSGDGDVRRAPSRSPHVIVQEHEARQLHLGAHRPGCWCDGLDGDAFLVALFMNSLRPRGFRMSSMYAGPGLMIRNGPGIEQNRADELQAAIRAGVPN
jgi:hypothetical protein